MKDQLRQTQVLLLLLAAALTMASCGTHNKLRSPSRPYYQEAKDQWKSGNHLAALYSATEGVLADRVYTNSKEFLYENYDNTMKDIKQELPKYKNTKDTAKAVRRLEIYNYLVAINENIAEMEMPLKHHKDKWKWSTKPEDYTKEKKQAREKAYDVFYNLAEKKLQAAEDRTEVKEADRIFVTGHNRYTNSGSEKRQTSLENITEELCTFADKHKEADTWQEVIMAADAFHYAKKYTKDSVRVYEGFEYTSERVSKLLTEDAQRYTKKGDLQSLLNANKLYENAITWNKDNEEAKKLKEELKPKIAEGYYQKAKEMDQQPNADLESVKSFYAEAMKWVPDYKDSQARIYSVSVRNELVTLEKNIDATQKEFDVVFERMKNVAGGVNTANSVMDDITYVTENLRSLDKTLHTTSLAMKPLNLIPVVNVVSKTIDVSARGLRIPVHRTVESISPVEKKSVTPANKAVKKLKFYTDMTVQKMGTTQKTLINSKKTAASLKTCIHKVNDEKALKESEKAIIELNKGLVEIQKRLKDINNSTNDLIVTANQIIGVSEFTAPVKGGIKSVKPAIHEVKKVTNEIDKVLDKSFLGISGRKALSVGGSAGDMAMKLLEPLLNKMNINFPEIPGMAELEAEMAKFGEKYNLVKRTTDDYKKKYNEYSDVQGRINRNLNKLVEKTGCGVGVENFDPVGGVYKIKSPYSNKYWDISGRGSSTNKNGANIQLWSMDSGKDRLVKFIPADGDAFFIEFQNGGRVLDVSGGNVDKGTNLQAWAKNGSGAQQFVMIPVDGKKDVFSIINVKSGNAVDASGGNTNKNGTNLHIWEFSETNKAQHWQLVKVSGKTKR